MSAVEIAAPFFDSNVFVYAADSTAGIKRERALQLIEATWGQKKGHLSIQVLQEFFYTITRKLPNVLTISEGRTLVEDYARWQIHMPQSDDILSAIDLQSQYRISFWDAMILQSAFALGCDTIYSEDFDPQRTYQGMRVVNPFV